ncbi:hypothetical protein [Peribacillus frigoritolerans]
MKFSLPDFKVMKAIKQTTPNETNNQTAPLKRSIESVYDKTNR